MNMCEPCAAAFAALVFALIGTFLPWTPFGKYVIALGGVMYAAATYILHLIYTPPYHE